MLEQSSIEQALAHHPYISENEGKVVVSGRHTFRIVNGVRIWLSHVPDESRRDIVADPYARDNTQMG
jgi:hypothetical protein